MNIQVKILHVLCNQFWGNGGNMNKQKSEKNAFRCIFRPNEPGSRRCRNKDGFGPNGYYCKKHAQQFEILKNNMSDRMGENHV